MEKEGFNAEGAAVEVAAGGGGKPTQQLLRELAVGETLSFPSSRTGSVRAMCSQMGFQWGRKFATHADRAHNAITVTRTL